LEDAGAPPNNPPTGKPSKKISPKKQLTPKQRALDLGVAESSHQLIAFTDADMVLAQNWIESLVAARASLGADLVFGHTAVGTRWVIGDGKAGKRTRFFALLEAFQLEFLFAAAYAFSKLGLAGSCMGNNVLLTKKGYEECGGQRGVGRSVAEDRALLALFKAKGFKTAAAEPFRATAETRPSRSAGQFFSQAARWAKGGLRPGGGLFTTGVLLITQNTVFLLCAAGAITGEIVAQTSANFLLTWLFAAAAFHKNRSPSTILLYPIYYIFMMIETAVCGAMVIFGQKLDWKGRKL
jgi:cellulose synthase/poly-beta-1,6-N-acetylglucosamine synthase-like glycosyltransferase